MTLQSLSQARHQHLLPVPDHTPTACNLPTPWEPCLSPSWSESWTQARRFLMRPGVGCIGTSKGESLGTPKAGPSGD